MYHPNEKYAGLSVKESYADADLKVLVTCFQGFIRLHCKINYDISCPETAGRNTHQVAKCISPECLNSEKI
jgi:hypothetical protein